MRKVVRDIEHDKLEHQQCYRDAGEVLCNRLWLLTPADRMIMQMYLDQRASVRQLAQLTGTSPSTVARRIKRLSERLLRNRYLSCLADSQNFTELQRRIARQYFFEGSSIRQIAQHNGLSFYRTRQIIRHISECTKQRV
jgi:DNA-directed RNA polymerase specialized sigma subunit